MVRRSGTEADCYSAGERSAMAWGRELRQRGCAPLLKLLGTCGITPDHLTLAALLVGLSFVPLYFYSKTLALLALGAHVLLDGLDGPLARHLAVSSRKGSLSDTASDQLVVVASTLTLMTTHTIGVAAGGVYVFLYTVVVVFAMVRNALRIPYAWLVRPRLIVYAWLVVEMYAVAGTIDYVLWGFNAVLALKMTSGFVRIRRRI